MIPCSDTFKQATRYPHGLSVTVDLITSKYPWSRDFSVVAKDVPVISAAYQADFYAKARLTADVTLANDVVNDLVKDRLSVEGSRLRLKAGITTIGYTEELTLGTFRVDDMEPTDDEQYDVSCSGLEAYIIDARFLKPVKPPYGASTIETIKTLIRQILPNQKIIVEATRDAKVQLRAIWQRERWDAIEALATSINAEVFADWRGAFVIRNIPKLAGGTPTIELDEGTSGVLLSRSQKQTRDRVYNAVAVSGTSTDTNKTPPFAWSYDRDKASPTYYYGPFGQVPRFYVSQFLRTNAQCQDIADRMLADAKAANRSLSVESLTLLFAEVEDRARITLLDGSRETHMISKMTTNLGVGGSMKIDTISTKNLATGE